MSYFIIIYIYVLGTLDQYPDNIAEAAHQRAGSGSCGHPRRSRQWTSGESANWRCSGPAPAEPSLPVPDSAGASHIAAGLCPCHLLSIVIYHFLFTYFLNFLDFILIPPLNARVLLLLHVSTCILHMQLLPTLSKARAFKAEIIVQIKKTCKLLRVCRCNCHFYYIHYVNRKKCDCVPGIMYSTDRNPGI